MSAPNQLLEVASPALVRALGWTLLHSFWQGAVLALGASLLLMLLHRHAAAVRYRVSAGALGLLLAWSGLTFGYYYQAAPTPAAAATYELRLSDAAAETGAAAAVSTASAEASLASRRSAPAVLATQLATGRVYFERHLPLLVAGWLLGMLAMTLRFLGGLAYVQRLKHYRVAALPAVWQARLDALALRAGLRRRVRLLASALVPGPLVVGWLRPVILLPLSAATGLSDRELEAILAHELAHVRRHDYLLNLLQSIAEILFFYHPAVWFLSASLRTERENCCDDLATELCGDPVVLARALATLAALSLAPELAPPRLALAAAGPAGSLLGRVRRLVRHRAEVPTFLEGFGAACVVLAGSVVLVLSTVASLNASPVPLFRDAASEQSAAAGVPAAPIVPAPAAVPAELATEVPATPAARPLADDLGTPTPGDTIIVSAETNARLLTKSGRTRLTDIQGLTVVVQDGAGNLREVYADGRKVPAADLPAYRAALAGRATRDARIGKESAAQDAAAARLQRMELIAQRMARQALAGDTVSAADAETLSSDALVEGGASLAANQPLSGTATQSRADKQESALRAAESNLLRKLRALEKKPAGKAQAQQRQALNQQLQGTRNQLALLRQPRGGRRTSTRTLTSTVTSSGYAILNQGVGTASGYATSNQGTGATTTITTATPKAPEPEDKLIRQMMRDGLIKDRNYFKYFLSADELIINGRRQPAPVHQKYLKLWASVGGFSLDGKSGELAGLRDISISVSEGHEQPTRRSGRRTHWAAPPVPPVPAMPALPPVPAMPPMPPMPPMPVMPPAPPAPPKLDSDRIRTELRRDGLLGAKEKDFTLSFSDDSGLAINGRQQSEAMATKYRPLLGLSSKRGQVINITVKGEY